MKAMVLHKIRMPLVMEERPAPLHLNTSRQSGVTLPVAWVEDRLWALSR